MQAGKRIYSGVDATYMGIKPGQLDRQKTMRQDLDGGKTREGRNECYGEVLEAELIPGETLSGGNTRPPRKMGISVIISHHHQGHRSKTVSSHYCYFLSRLGVMWEISTYVFTVWITTVLRLSMHQNPSHQRSKMLISGLHVYHLLF